METKIGTQRSRGSCLEKGLNLPTANTGIESRIGFPLYQRSTREGGPVHALASGGICAAAEAAPFCASCRPQKSIVFPAGAEEFPAGWFSQIRSPGGTVHKSMVRHISDHMLAGMDARYQVLER
jgi:hypothetical protein